MLEFFRNQLLMHLGHYKNCLLYNNTNDDAGPVGARKHPTKGTNKSIQFNLIYCYKHLVQILCQILDLGLVLYNQVSASSFCSTT